MLKQPGRNWPVMCAIVFLLALIAFIRPWSELPVNDDWLYAHVAKKFAEKGTLVIDVPVASTLVGQSLIAWPVISIFGFSHLALRILTLFLSVLILAELDYLLCLAAVSAGMRLVALCLLVANPFFLHLSTSFMTENYAYAVGLSAACLWFHGRRRDRSWLGVLAAAVAGCGFWIRQLSALVLPALMVAEFVAAGGRLKDLRPLLTRRALAVGVWGGIIVAYFVWARITGNVTRQLSEPLVRLLGPDPLIMFWELGIFLFYMTFFFAPFLFAYMGRERPSLGALLIPTVLLLTAGFAWRYGDWSGSPRANLRPIFPFLHNVFTKYGVGPITLTDVYWNNSQIRPRVSDVPWIIFEALAIVMSLAWRNVMAAARAQKNEVGIFGLCLALMSFVAVALSFQSAIFDRYHYPGILGFTLALPALFPHGSEPRLHRGAFLWVGTLALFSTLSLHDYFRWNEVRADLVREAQRRGIALSQLDAGYEVNGWNDVEGIGVSADCGPQVFWFCQGRRYRIGLEQTPGDHLILSRATDAWLVRFPDLKLLERP